jgi:tetratricopeptide (TPR) repeat protein
MIATIRSLAYLATFAFLTSATSLSAAAEFTDYYKVGLAAMESEDWGQASEMMSRAIAIQPVSKARIKKALSSKPYLPHYYLGAALHAQGDCEGALASWQEAEHQGTVMKFPQHARIQEGRDACSRRRSEVESYLAQAEEAISVAATSRDQARLLLGDLMLSDVDGLEYLSERLETAESNFQEAEHLLSQADGDLELLHRSVAQAAEADDGFNSVSFESSRWLESIGTEQVLMRAELEQLVLDSKRSLTASEYLKPYPPSIARLRQHLEGLASQAGGLNEYSSKADVDSLAGELEQAIADLDELAAKPPPELSQAAVAFLDGEYEEVLQILAETDRSSNRVAVQAHLFQAAALYSLYRAQGESQPELLERATQEVLSYQSFNKSLPRLPFQIFSPRFIEFFESQRTMVVADTSGNQG